jgi:hypothetical protein
MPKKVLPLVLVTALASLLTAAKAHAWIGDGFGYVAPGPNGQYNAGGSVGRYGGLYYGGGGYQYNNYSGAYRASFGQPRVSNPEANGRGSYAAGKSTPETTPNAARFGEGTLRGLSSVGTP